VHAGELKGLGVVLFGEAVAIKNAPNLTVGCLLKGLASRIDRCSNEAVGIHSCAFDKNFNTFRIDRKTSQVIRGALAIFAVD
jgi:hypothetical protein